MLVTNSSFFFYIDFAGNENEDHTSSPTMLLASTWPPKSMLSYIIPVDSSKQTQSDASADHRQQHHLQLSLIQGRFANGNATTTTTTTTATSTPISKETSISSFASDGTTATITSSSMTNTSASDRHKTTKIVINGKHQPLKRWEKVWSLRACV